MKTARKGANHHKGEKCLARKGSKGRESFRETGPWRGKPESDVGWEFSRTVDILLEKKKKQSLRKIVKTRKRVAERMASVYRMIGFVENLFRSSGVREKKGIRNRGSGPGNDAGFSVAEAKKRISCPDKVVSTHADGRSMEKSEKPYQREVLLGELGRTRSPFPAVRRARVPTQKTASNSMSEFQQKRSFQ